MKTGGGYQRARPAVGRTFRRALICSVAIVLPGAACAATPAQDTPAAAGQAAPQARRTATIALPLILNDQQLPDVTAELATDSVISVSPVSLADSLGAAINAKTQSAIRALGEGLVTIDRIRALGIDLRLNQETLTITAQLALTTRGETVISASGDVNYGGVERLTPSKFAIGLTGGLLATSDLSSKAINTSSVGLSGFVNIGGVRGVNIVSSGTLGLTGAGRSFQRDRIVAFVDRPGSALRYSVGDLVPQQSGLAGSFDVLGVSIERNYSALQPTRNIRPLGNRSFQLERKSTVEIYVNGALVQSFLAEAGPIDLRNIPAANLSNTVSIVVQDSLGRREISNFTLGNDITLLAAGYDEFSFAGGVLHDRFSTTGGFDYSHDPVASAYYSRGLSETTTVGGSLIVSKIVQNAGASLARALLGGVGQIEVSGSRVQRRGSGGAVGVSYRGDPLRLAESRNANMNLRFFVQSKDYRNLNDFDLAQVTKVEGAVDYRFNITERLSLNFGGNYYTTYGARGADWAVTAGGQRNIGRFSVSANARYLSRSDGKKDIGAFLTLSRPLGRYLTATATADTTSGRGRVEVRKVRSLSLPQVEYAVNAQYGPNDRQVGGNFAYTTSRFEGEVTVAKQFDDRAGSPSLATVRLQSGIAFVDGHFGIGRDTGSGFVMVDRHATLKDSRIEVTEGAAGRKLGQADGFGPAVIPIENPYRPLLLRMNGIDLPDGYDIGAGDYVALSGARSGILVEIGSDAFHTVVATLLSGDGKPISLISGKLRDVKTGKVTTFFTNRAGRAVFTMLAPGHYEAQIDGRDDRYAFDVAKDTPALTNVGPVTMERQP